MMKISEKVLNSSMIKNWTINDKKVTLSLIKNRFQILIEDNGKLFNIFENTNGIQTINGLPKNNFSDINSLKIFFTNTYVILKTFADSYKVYLFPQVLGGMEDDPSSSKSSSSSSSSSLIKFEEVDHNAISSSTVSSKIEELENKNDNDIQIIPKFESDNLREMILKGYENLIDTMGKNRNEFHESLMTSLTEQHKVHINYIKALNQVVIDKLKQLDTTNIKKGEKQLKLINSIIEISEKQFKLGSEMQVSEIKIQLEKQNELSKLEMSYFIGITNELIETTKKLYESKIKLEKAKYELAKFQQELEIKAEQAALLKTEKELKIDYDKKLNEVELKKKQLENEQIIHYQDIKKQQDELEIEKSKKELEINCKEAELKQKEKNLELDIKKLEEETDAQIKLLQAKEVSSSSKASRQQDILKLEIQRDRQRYDIENKKAEIELQREILIAKTEDEKHKRAAEAYNKAIKLFNEQREKAQKQIDAIGEKGEYELKCIEPSIDPKTYAIIPGSISVTKNGEPI